MKKHQQAMLDGGWIAVRDLSGEITHWQDPNEARHIWSDWEVEMFYFAGDYPSIPRMRRPFEADENVV